MRRELGRQLAARRKAAGLVQRELGRMAGYSRSAIANAETGNAITGRRLWQGADRALGTGEVFTRGHDRIQAHIGAEAQARAEKLVPADLGQPGDGGLATVPASRAWQAYQDRGWPADQDPGGRLWLVTGTVLDALEVPQLAGMVAISWWLYTRGVPDPIRCLPALPDPAGALAVISTGTRCYFLARPGSCPWTSPHTTTAEKAGAAMVRWHAQGGRVPAPPSPLQDGQRAWWAHAPSQGGLLASPMALLHLLAQATATTDGTALILPGGVRAVPATPAPRHQPNGTRQQAAAGATASS
jgi:transcriptional regulator with XRE-family HTH domain